MSTPTKPPRLRLINLDTEEMQGFQFNPTQLDLGLKAVYNKVPIPGQSHTQRQFSHTDDLQLAFELAFVVTDAKSGIKTEAERELGNQQFSTYATTRQAANQSMSIETVTSRFTLEERVAAENFLTSLCVPTGDNVISRNAPPKVLVVWPNFLSFEAIMLEVNLSYTRFNNKLQPVEFKASVKMEEIRELRYTSLDQRIQGFYKTHSARAEEP